MAHSNGSTRTFGRLHWPRHRRPRHHPERGPPHGCGRGCSPRHQPRRRPDGVAVITSRMASASGGTVLLNGVGQLGGAPSCAVHQYADRVDVATTLGPGRRKTAMQCFEWKAGRVDSRHACYRPAAVVRLTFERPALGLRMTNATSIARRHDYGVVAAPSIPGDPSSWRHLGSWKHERRGQIAENNASRSRLLIVFRNVQR